MEVRPDDARVPALQLLLGDLDANEKQALLYLAFPDDFMLLRKDLEAIRGWLQSAKVFADRALEIADSSSPLGRLAVDNLRREVTSAKSNIRTVAGILGLSL